MSGIGKISILNYEYLMLQSFVDPFSIKAVLHTSKNDSGMLMLVSFHFYINKIFLLCID